MHVGDPAAIEAAFAELDAQGRAATILVNNAAANPYFGPMVDMDLGSYEKTVEVNLRGYFWSTVQAARRMRAAGGGAIVNIASVNARRAAPGRASTR
jgi:NAD(P)-dependent dehydrogenase (short-subunit alcohol dehydrogenase family)